VTLVGTPIPGMIVFWADYFKAGRAAPPAVAPHDSLDVHPPAEQDASEEDQAAAPHRCPHCGEVLPTLTGGECPACRMTLQEDHYA
jgi:hypothetical protein